MSLEQFLIKDTKTRRQELPTYYRLNGAIYLCKVKYFLRYKDLYKEKSYAYIMNRRNSVDVDDKFDFEMVENLIKGFNLTI